MRLVDMDPKDRAELKLDIGKAQIEILSLAALKAGGRYHAGYLVQLRDADAEVLLNFTVLIDNDGKVSFVEEPVTSEDRGFDLIDHLRVEKN